MLSHLFFTDAEKSFLPNESEGGYGTSVDYPLHYVKDDFQENIDNNDIVNPKRGWEAINFAGKKRNSLKNDDDDKRGWEGMDFRFDVDGMKLPKRGWEGLNFQYRWTGQSSNQARLRNRMLKYGGRKRGWEGVDTCSCCHSNHKEFCCLACNRQIAYRKPRVPRITTKSGKSMFYVRNKVCKCCYAANVKDCCDICEKLS